MEQTQEYQKQFSNFVNFMERLEYYCQSADDMLSELTFFYEDGAEEILHEMIYEYGSKFGEHKNCIDTCKWCDSEYIGLEESLSSSDRYSDCDSFIDDSIEEQMNDMNIG